jgi:carbonic anhydrase/acetyltransferase-like protein (isoleucine patch superfamily)
MYWIFMVLIRDPGAVVLRQEDAQRESPVSRLLPGPSSASAADSAAVVGDARGGRGSWLAQGTVVRSIDGAVEVGAGSFVLENSVVVGRPSSATQIGRRTVFGHRCLVMGSTVGDLCEVGNGSVLLPGSVLGDRCFLGEGTVISPGAIVPDQSVVVGRPGRVIRRANGGDLERLTALRDGDLDLPRPEGLASLLSGADGGNDQQGDPMGRLYEFRGTWPTVAESATLFDSAELTGDIVVGADSVIGAGVKILGDSHGTVRIGRGVQILENTVLHLLPDNELVIEDDVVIGPGAMIHGCHLGAATVVEPGAIVCDWSSLGEECVVRAGAVVKQRSKFGARSVIDGFPARTVETGHGRPDLPVWAFQPGDLATLRKR